MPASSSRLIIDAITRKFQAQKEMAQKAVAQLPDGQIHVPLDANTNSIAVIMKHMGGNLRSRFTDFLAADGEKPGRDRDSEFVDDIVNRGALLDHWETGWKCLFDTLASLSDADLDKTVKIRGQAHTVIDALVRALDHQGYHVGQIVQLARFLAKDQWTTLTVPRGGTKQFNESMRAKFGA